MKKFTKKIIGTVILLTVILCAVNGQTNVSGGIYTNTTWTLTKAHSMIYLGGLLLFTQNNIYL